MARRLSLSVLTSSVGAVVNALSGLVTAAFLLRQLGLETFGIWALVVSTTSLLWLLDLGMTISVGRLIAARRATDDVNGVNQIVSAAIVMLGACAGAVALLTCFVPSIFLLVFTVPPEAARDVALALWLMGLASAVHFLAAPFTCLLWGYERLDLINLIDVPVILLRLLLLFILVGVGSPIWIVAGCTLFTGCLAAVTHGITGFVVEPRLAPRARLATRTTMTTILRLGVDFAALSITRTLAVQLSPMLVGHTLGNVAAGVFSIARQLSANCNTLVSATTEAIAARSVRLFHEEAVSDQRVLFVEGGRFTTALACLLTIGLLMLGDSFIHLWQSGRADEAYYQLRILMLGEVIGLSQWVTFWVIAGVRKHRILSLFAICECVAIVALSYLLVGRFGLAGISLATAAGAAIFRGVAPLIYGIRLLEIPYREYAARVIWPNALGCLVAGVAAYWLDVSLAPRTWSVFVMAGFMYVAIFAASFAPFLFARPLLSRIRHFYRGRPALASTAGREQN